MSELSIQSQPESGISGLFNFSCYDDAMKMAKVIASSNFCPTSFNGKPENVLLAIQFGNELGLKPLASLQNIAIMNGRPSIFGDAVLAICKNSADYEYVREWRENTEEGLTAFCEAKRKGEPAKLCKFSKKDAITAGLWDKRPGGKPGPWVLYPERMLEMRARGFALRDVWPHLLKGFITVEEAQDYPEKDITPVKSKVVQMKTKHPDDVLLDIQNLMVLLDISPLDLNKMLSALAGKDVVVDFVKPENITIKQRSYILKALKDEEAARHAQSMEDQADE